MAIVRYQPFDLFRELDKDFFPGMQGFWADDGSSKELKSWAPRADLEEQNDSFVVYADLPGVAPENISIEMEGNTLTIKGERTSESEKKDKNFYKVERFAGKFFRSFSLPESIDKEAITAKTKQGVLTVTLPKVKQNLQKKIEVSGE